MTASFVEVSPATPGGAKMQSFQNAIGGNAVDAEAVVLVDPNGVPTPLEQATFGALVVESRSSQISADFVSTLAQNSVQATTTNGGTATQANGSATITTSANANGTSRLQTIGTTSYAPGREIYVMFTALFTTPTSANSNQRAGIYDTNNGFFLGFAGLTFGITSRNLGVDNFVVRGAWNGDPIDGSAGSLFTRDGVPEAIDFTKRNIFRIRFGWLGDAPIRFEVYSPDGAWVLFNTIREPNLVTGPSISNPNLPITMEVTKAAADATDLVMTTSSWDAGIAAARQNKQNSNIDAGNSSTTPLGIGAVFTGIGIDVAGFSVISVYVFADQQGSLAVQFSTNNVNWETFQTATVNAANPRHYSYVPQARFFRVVYTNGGTGQAAFRLQTIERPAATPPDNQYNTSGALITAATTELSATGTLANGAETAVANVAVSILAANANRKTAIVQNTGAANIRVGVAGVTAVTGFRLAPGESLTYNMPFVPTQELFAIREGAISSTAFTQEIT